MWSETEHAVRDIYGSATKSTKESYDNIKMMVAERVAAVKEAGETIDKDKYVSIVEKVVDDYKKDFEKTKNGTGKMIDFLKKGWEKVKKALVSQEKVRSDEAEKDRQ